MRLWRRRAIGKCLPRQQPPTQCRTPDPARLHCHFPLLDDFFSRALSPAVSTLSTESSANQNVFLPTLKTNGTGFSLYYSVVSRITHHYTEFSMSVMSLRIPDEIADTLANLAKATGRTKSYLAVDALREYLAREAWQIEEIQKALKEADAGDFASDEEVRAIAEKWNANAS
jgi:predicted transcriptional regulator